MSDVRENFQSVMNILITKRSSLKQLVDSLAFCQDQVAFTARDHEAELKKHFKMLKEILDQALDKRLGDLENQIRLAEKESVAKVETWRQQAERDLILINEDLCRVEAVLDAGNEEEMNNFKIKSEKDSQNYEHNQSLQQLLNISLHLPSELQYMNLISCHGKVSTQPILIISQLVPKVSSVFLKWESYYSENCTGSEVYLLQFSEVDADAKVIGYVDIYKGSSTSYVACKLKPNQKYAFRVSWYKPGSNIVWSIPRFITTLTPLLRWREDVKSCVLLNDGASLSTSSSSTVLFVSSTRSDVCGRSLTMTIESAPCKIEADDDGFGLSILNEDQIKLFNRGTLFITCNGAVCVDNQKMITKLPCIKAGSTIIFSSEVLPAGKIRVTVEVNEKVVTFDWLIQNESMASFIGSNSGLHFFARLTSPGWIVTVE